MDQEAYTGRAISNENGSHGSTMMMEEDLSQYEVVSHIQQYMKQGRKDFNSARDKQEAMQNLRASRSNPNIQEQFQTMQHQ